MPRCGSISTMLPKPCLAAEYIEVPDSEPQNLRPSKLLSGRGRSSTRGWLIVLGLAFHDPALERRDDHVEDVVVERAALVLVDPQARELVRRKAAAEAEDRAPVRDVVEVDDRLGQPHRIAPRHDDHLRAELHPLGPPGEVGEQLQRIVRHRVVGEVVLGDPHRIEPEFLGEHEVLELLADELRVGVSVAALVRETGGQAYVHAGILSMLAAEDAQFAGAGNSTLATPPARG